MQPKTIPHIFILFHQLFPGNVEWTRYTKTTPKRTRTPTTTNQLAQFGTSTALLTAVIFFRFIHYHTFETDRHPLPAAFRYRTALVNQALCTKANKPYR